MYVYRFSEFPDKSKWVTCCASGPNAPAGSVPSSSSDANGCKSDKIKITGNRGAPFPSTAPALLQPADPSGPMEGAPVQNDSAVPDRALS